MSRRISPEPARIANQYARNASAAAASVGCTRVSVLSRVPLPSASSSKLVAIRTNPGREGAHAVEVCDVGGLLAASQPPGLPRCACHQGPRRIDTQLAEAVLDERFDEAAVSR